ncbi:MAG: rhodanese-like domain-containing protein, partial [Phycisphaerales bacterium]
VWPGHGAGSACGKALGAVPMSTVGYERRFNPALKLAIDDGASEGSFVSFILEGPPEPPMYFANMKRVNRDGPPVLGSLPQPYQVRLSDLAKIDPQQVAIIDTRPWPQYRDGHLPGAMSFPLSTTFNTDAGSMVREDEQIYLIVEPERLEEAVRDLVRIGLDRIVGWMDPTEMANAAKTASIAEVSPSEAAQRIDRGEVAVLDVRRATEFAAGRLDGAQNIAHTRLASRLDELPADRTLLIHCQGGIRSARACGYLQRLGYGVINMEGGYEAWQRAHTTANA